MAVPAYCQMGPNLYLFFRYQILLRNFKSQCVFSVNSLVQKYAGGVPALSSTTVLNYCLFIRSGHHCAAAQQPLQKPTILGRTRWSLLRLAAEGWMYLLQRGSVSTVISLRLFNAKSAIHCSTGRTAIQCHYNGSQGRNKTMFVFPAARNAQWRRAWQQAVVVMARRRPLARP